MSRASYAEKVEANFLAAHPDAVRVCLPEPRYNMAAVASAVNASEGMVTVTVSQQTPRRWVFYVTPEAQEAFRQIRSRYRRQ